MSVDDTSRPNAATTIRRVGLRDLPAPDRLEVLWDEGAVCVIKTDGGSLAASLARALTDEGWRVVILDSAIPVPSENGAGPHLERVRPTGWDDAFPEIAGRIACFIEINANSDLDEAGLLSNGIEASQLKASFFTAKKLQPILTAPGAFPAWFIAITTIDGRLGLGAAEKERGVVGAGIYGLVKTLRHEWPRVFCRAIDLHPALDSDTAASLVVGEMFDADLTLGEVGIGPEWRCTIAAGERLHA